MLHCVPDNISTIFDLETTRDTKNIKLGTFLDFLFVINMLTTHFRLLQFSNAGANVIFTSQLPVFETFQENTFFKNLYNWMFFQV